MRILALIFPGCTKGRRKYLSVVAFSFVMTTLAGPILIAYFCTLPPKVRSRW